MTQNFQISKRLVDGTIIVLGGDNFAEFSDNVGAALEDPADATEVINLFSKLVPIEAAEMNQAVQTVQNAFPGAQQQAPPPGWGSAPPPQQNGGYQQQPAGQPPMGGAPACVHGPAKWVPPGVSKGTGRQYPGFWACAAPRGQQCPKGTF